MSIAIQDLITQAMMETKTTAEAGVKPADWFRWACDGVTETFLFDGQYRINPDFSVQVVPFTADPSATPPAAIPDQIAPYSFGLQKYIEFRYHSTMPENSGEKEAAADCYAKFLSAFGIKTPQKA